MDSSITIICTRIYNITGFCVHSSGAVSVARTRELGVDRLGLCDLPKVVWVPRTKFGIPGFLVNASDSVNPRRDVHSARGTARC